MTVSTICRRCRRIKPCGCPTTDPRKVEKARFKKYTSSHWQRTRRAVLARDNHRCVQCGSTTDLTVDLLAGHDHSKANPSDCVTRCRVCHGRKDGGKR